MPEMLETEEIIFTILDGPNVFHMARCLGIAVLNYSELFKILTEEIGGSALCFGKPVYVLIPEQAEKKRTALEREGFEVVPMDTKDSADDGEIIRRINELPPGRVSKIVLVSANFRDFQDCLDAKIAMGIRVILVATKVVDEGTNRPMLSVDFDERRGAIEFVDLEPYKDRLMRKPWDKEKAALAKAARSVEKNGLALNPAPPAAVVVKTINLSLEVGVKDFNSVFNAVSAILKMPGLLNSTLGVK